MFFNAVAQSFARHAKQVGRPRSVPAGARESRFDNSPFDIVKDDSLGDIHNQRTVPI